MSTVQATMSHPGPRPTRFWGGGRRGDSGNAAAQENHTNVHNWCDCVIHAAGQRDELAMPALGWGAATSLPWAEQARRIGARPVPVTPRNGACVIPPPPVVVVFPLPSKILAPAAHQPRTSAHVMPPTSAPLSASRQNTVYRPPCVDLWTSVYPKEVLALQHVKKTRPFQAKAAPGPTTAPLSPPCLHCTCRIGTGTAANTSLNGVNAAISRWSALAAVDSAPRSRHLRKRPTSPRRFLRLSRPRQRLFLCPIRRR